MGEKLTARELEVLELAARGRLNKEIAAELGVSLYTIRSHFSNIREKLGADNKASAVAIAMAKGELKLEEKGDDSE